jgi:undecaprenyl-diphosphatase
MTLWQAIVLAFIEGLTEYLPVSSTGHMILGTALMGIKPDAFVKFFTICIQLGAILSVIVLYFPRFFKSFGFYYKLFFAFVPAIFAGLLFSELIDKLLENPLGVALSLLLGGIILLYVDRWFANNSIQEEKGITNVKALKIGMFQCIALIPGISRSGATIVGGMSLGLTRKLAAEFSFFLAVPTMFAATAKKFFDFIQEGYEFTNDQLYLLLVGNLVAFLVAMIAIKSFIGFLAKYGFKSFGWYRIIIGIIIILFYVAGVSLQIT